MKSFVAFLLFVSFGSSWAQSPTPPPPGPGSHAASAHPEGSAAQWRGVCETEVECSEVLAKRTTKVKEGTGIDKEVVKTGERTVRSGLFSTRKESYTYKTKVHIEAEEVTDLPEGTVLRTYTRPFRASALDVEGANEAEVLKEARARLDRATKAISQGSENDVGMIRWFDSPQGHDTRLVCQAKHPEKTVCSRENIGRQISLNQMLEPQNWTGGLLEKMPKGEAYVFSAHGGGSSQDAIYDRKFRSGQPLVDLDPFHLGDAVLMKEALQVKSRLPVPDRMYCYFAVEKTRPFIEGGGSVSSRESTSVSASRYDRNFLFLMRRATSGLSVSHSSSSDFSFFLNTQYRSSGLLVLEDIAERGSYTNPLEMKQDSCNRAQERYLVANTFADVLVGCHCASRRILPNSRVADYRMFEY